MKLVLGFAIGVALGLVFAPASGEKTRAQLKNEARDFTRHTQGARESPGGGSRE